MVGYSKINCKLTNVQLNKLKKAVKSNEGAILRLSIKNFNKDEHPHELLLITRPLMKVAMPLAKNVLTPLGLTAAMSAIDGSIQKKIHGSGVKLIIEQEDMNDIMKTIEALENSGILLKGVSKTIENETKEQKGGFLSMLLGTLGASLLGNLLSGGKGIMRAGEGSITSKAKGEGIVRAAEGSKKKNLNSLLPFHPLKI